MIRRHITVLRLLFMAADGMSAMLLFGAISVLRFGSPGWLAAWSVVGLDGRILGIAYAVIWVASVWLLGLYRLRSRLSLRNELADLLRADVLVAVATFAILFLFKLPGVSRLFLLELFTAQLALAVVVRVAMRVTFAWARAHGHNTRWVLVVGTGPLAEAFADRLERHQELGLRVIGHLECHPDDPYLRSRRAVLGTLEDVSTILHERVVDEVAVCLSVADLALVEPVARLCEEEGRVVRIPVGEVAFSLPGGRIEELDGHPILSLVYGPDRALGLAAKRLLDMVVACAVLMVLSPVYLGIAVWIRAIDGSPILFRQERMGLHGRKFQVVKFRSMVPDAEARRKELDADNEISGPAFKLSHDPRLSRTGGTLRRMSLDELPQFWNVLRGEMSIVGPRPPLPDEVADYDIWHRRRLSMKPGITGLWQVAARREQEFDRWVSIDLDYIDRWSLWLDLKIMVRTVPAMLQGR